MRSFNDITEDLRKAVEDVPAKKSTFDAAQAAAEAAANAYHDALNRVQVLREETSDFFRDTMALTVPGDPHVRQS